MLGPERRTQRSAMFGIFRKPGAAQQLSPTDELARDIAERSVSAAQHRLHAEIGTMSIAELRGYIRARAIHPVRQNAQRVIAGYGRNFVAGEDLLLRALDRTVHLVLRELLAQRDVCVQPAGRLRRAG